METLGNDSVAIWLRGANLTPLDVRPGQFVAVRFVARGLWTTSHPYSVSAVEDGMLRLTIRTTGNHSARAAAVAAGTWVIAEGPYGAFTSRRQRTAAPALLIGAGVGIAPLLPITDALLAPGETVDLVVRDTVEHVHADELRALALRGATVHSMLGARATLGHDPLTALPELVDEIADRDVWVCGPPGFIATAVAICQRAGVPAAHIHVEEFAW